MPTYAAPLSNGRQSPQGFLPILSKLFTSQGVIDDGLKVTEQLTPDMTVSVSGSLSDDYAVFIASNGHFIQAWNTEPVNVLIPANSTGVTKTDALVAYVDLDGGDAVNPNNPSALKFESVRRDGVLTGLPDDIEIKDIIGANNPYFILAEVTVENGETAINSGDLVDVRPRAGLDASILADDSIESQQIQDNAISHNHIGNSQVIESKIASSAVTTTKVANNAITTDKVLNAAITAAKMGNFPVVANDGGYRKITIKNITVWTRRFSFNPGSMSGGSSSLVGSLPHPPGMSISTPTPGYFRTSNVIIPNFGHWFAARMEGSNGQNLYLKNISGETRNPGTVTVDVIAVQF